MLLRIRVPRNSAGDTRLCLSTLSHQLEIGLSFLHVENILDLNNKVQ